ADGGGRGADARPGTVEAVNIHPLQMMLDQVRVAADQETAEVVHAGDDSTRLALEGALTPADESGVGLELHEDVGAVRLGSQGDAEHLHARDADARADPPECRAPGRGRQP